MASRREEDPQRDDEENDDREFDDEESEEDVDAFEVDDDEEILSSNVNDENTEESRFDEIVGILQDILIDPEFVGLQTEFCSNHCELFDNVSENKLIYTDIFEKYTALIESFLEQRLAERIEDFSMDEFCTQIQEHEDEIPGDVIDVLLSCSDFEEFKSLMLSFKQNESPQFEITCDPVICCSE